MIFAPYASSESQDWEWPIIVRSHTSSWACLGSTFPRISSLGFVIQVVLASKQIRKCFFCYDSLRRLCEVGGILFIKCFVGCAGAPILAICFLFEKILNYKFKFKSYRTTYVSISVNCIFKRTPLLHPVFHIY